MRFADGVTPAGDPVLVVYMQEQRDLLLGGHVHGCPECYEHVPCEHRCSIEPDLTLDDGTLRGAYVVCDACASERRSTTPKGGQG